MRLREGVIRQRRKEQGLTQEELAKAVGCSRSAVATWETTGRPPVGRRLRRVAGVLGVQAEDLLEPYEAAVPSLKVLRTLAGHNQATIAALLGVAVSTYSDVETGRQKIPARWFSVLAVAFNTDEGTIGACAHRIKTQVMWV